MVKKLSDLVSLKNWRDEDVLILFLEIRKALERLNLRKKMSVLTLYCDLMFHIRLDRSMEISRIMLALNTAMFPWISGRSDLKNADQITHAMLQELKLDLLLRGLFFMIEHLGFNYLNLAKNRKEIILSYLNLILENEVTIKSKNIKNELERFAPRSFFVAASGKEEKMYISSFRIERNPETYSGRLFLALYCLSTKQIKIILPIESYVRNVL